MTTPRLFGVTGDGTPVRIYTVDDWFEAAPPRGGRAQWVPLRSAYQLAEAWCGSGHVEVPQDLLGMLGRHPLLDGLELVEGWAEHKTPLRGEDRGPRVHDLLLVGRCAAGDVVIGIEGKADEAFDRQLQQRWAEAQATLSRGEATKWPDRLRRRARSSANLPR